MEKEYHKTVCLLTSRDIFDILCISFVIFVRESIIKYKAYFFHLGCLCFVLFLNCNSWSQILPFIAEVTSLHFVSAFFPSGTDSLTFAHVISPEAVGTLGPFILG